MWLMSSLLDTHVSLRLFHRERQEPSICHTLDKLGSLCKHSGMRRMAAELRLWVLLLAVLLTAASEGAALKLTPNFYSRSCPILEPLVESIVARHLQQDPTSAASLLRLFFHDCFVEGCDGSVLLESTSSAAPSEKTAVPNQTLRELNIIDEIKVGLESRCPGVVSCADILAVASRDAVVQSGGPTWAVEFGRRDGRISTAELASAHLPSSQLSAQPLIDIFAAFDLNVRDLVTLSGAHSFGRAHCFQIARRFYDWPGSRSGIDPALDPAYAAQLRRACPQPIDPASRVPNDPITPDVFDPFYYQDVLANKGLFSSDSALALDNHTRVIVKEYAHNGDSFFQHFGRSMIKLGRVGVKTGIAGEIRTRCGFVN